jgi:DNA-binding CsgD family transcriptional regulator
MKNLIQKLFAPENHNPASPREREVAGLIASGFTNAEVGAGLGISIKTVEKHRDHLHKKYGFRNTADLTRWALAQSLATNEWL